MIPRRTAGARADLRARIAVPIRCTLLGLLLASSGGCGGGAGPDARSHPVAIRGFRYEPAELVVAAGDTIVWTNGDIVPHTATAEGKGWDSGSIGAGESWRLVTGEKGEHSYLCTFHPGMKARIVVR